MDRILDGIRVVEFSHLIAAPLCGLTLRDLGAEVIKVEPRAGDYTRTLEPERPPVRLPVPLVDFTTGLYAVQSVLTSLLRVRTGGDGALLDCGMVDAASVLTSSVGVRAMHDEEPIRR